MKPEKWLKKYADDGIFEKIRRDYKITLYKFSIFGIALRGQVDDDDPDDLYAIFPCCINETKFLTKLIELARKAKEETK